MARLPNRKYSVGTGAQPTPAPVETEKQPTAFDDSWAAGFLMTMKRGMEVEAQGWSQRPADWNPLDHVPKGYEAQADAFAIADGPDQIPIIQRQVDEAIARDRRRAERGLAATLTNDLLVEVTNPLNYLPGGRAVGVGSVRGALSVGAANVGVGLVDEGLRAGADVNYQFNETDAAINVGSNALFGAAIGGTVGHVTRPKREGLNTGGLRATRAPLPIKGMRVGSRFGNRTAPSTRMGKGSSKHQGVDIPAPRGTRVEPQLGGKVIAVTKAESGHANGNSVTIDHGGGVVTKYLHLDSMDVRVGSTVTPGMRIGRVGSTGRSSGNHLHYQMELNGKAVDPLTTKLPEGVGHSVATPAQAIDQLAGVDVPDVLDFDGRSIPIVIGNTGTGAIASMRRPRPVGEIVDEIADVQLPTSRVIANDDVADPDTIEFDKLIAPDERFSAGRPWSNTLLLSEFDERLAKAEKAARRGSTDHDPEWLAKQRALVEAAYGEPDIPYVPSEAERLQAQRRGEASGDPRNHDPRMTADRTAGEASPANAPMQSKRLLAKAEGLRAWAEDALLRVGTDAAELDKKGRPYSKAFLNASLKAAMKDIETAEAMLDEVTYADGNWTVDEFGDAHWSPTDRTQAAERGPLDEGLAEIREQDRKKRGNDFSTGELDDNLPFGRAHVGEAGVSMNGDHIVFDLGAAIRAYSHQPWTQSHIDGVEPLPADAFPTLKSWLDFVVRHELTHAFEERMDGESLADYENRIVRRTMETLQADNASARPEGNWLQLKSLTGTPIKDVMDLVEDGQAAIFESIVRLASDGATFLERNVLGGAATPGGGSVFQRAHFWLREVYLTREAIRSGYLKSLGLRTDGTRMGREASILAQRIPFVGAKSRGQMTLDDFRAEVARAQVGFDDVMPEAAEAARVIEDGFKRIEVEARKQGMFEGQKERAIKANRKRQLARQYRNDAEFVERGGDHDLADDYRQSAERLEVEADALDTIAAEKPTMPFREERYWHRMWNPAAVEANVDGLRNILIDAYRRDLHPNPEAAADGAIDLILMEPTGTATHPPGSPSALKHRSIPVTNKEVFEFIVQDPETVAMHYYRRMGAAVEMTREFGDAAGLDELDRLRLDMRRRGVPDEKAKMALMRWLDARDRVAGGLHGSNPLSWGNRTARAARNFTALVSLGRVALSQIGDPLKSILVQGLGLRRIAGGEGSAGLIQGLAAHFNGDMHRFNIGGPAKLSAEGFELALARAGSRFIEEDDAVLVTRQTWVERKLAQLQAPNSVANLLAPITTVIKEAVGFVAAHNVLEDARLVSSAIRAGQEPDLAAMKRLGRNGIDTLDAHLLADMPVEMTENGLIMPNAMAWEGEGGERARRLLLGAVSGEVRRSVITPGALDRPRWFDGIVATKGKVMNSFDEMDAANRAYDEARDVVHALRGRAEDDPDLVAAQAVLEEKRLERFRARRELGRKARTELPLLSLPAQLHSFAMASGAKTLHGLWTVGERNKVGGLLAMLIGGVVVARLKMSDHQWEGMDWDEKLMSGFDNSGLGAIFLDAGKAIDNMLDLQMVPGNERDPEGEGVADELGAAAPFFGSALRMVDVFSDAAKADTIEVWDTMRRLPGFNIIWFQNAMDFIVGTFEGGEEKAPRLGRDTVMDGPPVVDDMTGRGRVMLDEDAPLFGPAPAIADPAIELLPGQREPDDLETVLSRIDPEIAAAIRAKAAKGRKRRKRIVTPKIRKPLQELL